TAGSFGYDPRGRLVELNWTGPGATPITRDQVVRSAAGRVTDQSIDGVDPNPTGQNYAYDPAGRLVDAYAPGHHYSYDYTAPTTGECQAATLSLGAHRNSNRTRTVDQPLPSGTPTTTIACYTQGDRLASTTAAGVGTISYDGRGRTTSLGTAT